MRRRGRTDSNHSAIVKELRQAGCSVQSLADIGEGCPDILVGWQGLNLVFEIKDGTLPTSATRLTQHEKAWHLVWRGQVAVIETAEQALNIMRKGN